MNRNAYPLAIFTLRGDEAAMGRQHGGLTRELGDWQATNAFYADMPGYLFGAGRRDRGRALLVKAIRPLVRNGMARLERARPDALRARTNGFLAALGRPADESRLLFVLDATQNVIGIMGRLGLMHQVQRLAAPGACSSFAVWGAASEDGRLLHARNFDLHGIGIWERTPTVVFCAPERGLRYGFVATRGADVPGVTAFNETGIVVAAHTRFHREVTFDGLGVIDLGHLIASRATSLADAVAIASEQRIASSWGIVVSSARERSAIVIETHAGRIGVHRPNPGAEYLAVANRNRVPVMQPGQIAPSAAWLRYSNGREAVLERRLQGMQGMTAASAMALLGDHESGDVPGWDRMTGDCLAQTISVQSVVVDPERQELWVGVGQAPTSKGPWQRIPWRWDGPELDVLPAPRMPADTDPRAVAYAHFVEAARLEAMRGTESAVEASVHQAIALQPDDPSYRHIAGGLALRSNRPDEALAHFETALAHERSAFRQGELQHWATIAAAWSRDTRASLARRRHREIGVDFQLLTLTV